MLTIALAQHDFLVGDIRGNLEKALRLIEEARKAGAELLLFPEMALTGYPPEDLLLRPGFLRQSEQALADLVARVEGIDVVIGHPWREGGRRFNALTWARDGRVLGRYAKQLLPNYLVFDEQRYFSAGSEALVVELDGVRIGAIICEDAWEPGPAQQSVRKAIAWLPLMKGRIRTMCSRVFLATLSNCCWSPMPPPTGTISCRHGARRLRPGRRKPGCRSCIAT